ncbi:hypothetical protein HPS54_09805 [Prevotella sp. PCHR]|uniref:Uncharacterized protein n=1 Tax=Xylanibacter caecicola TaxID=2736294 RepID=A0ABX2B744_9BACT|nr:hypothetical protein [Xylanibacter caecicola]NPE25805.1 hypothetical protein [Xylanibacter caecicola]
MKKLLFMALLLCMTSISANGQEVYQEILRLSKKAVSDPSKSTQVKKINLFKVDELNYMAMKTKEVMPDSAVTVLDYQAFALYEFINLYMDKMGKTDKKKEKTTILNIFKSASINNPRFFDMDKPLVLSYYNNDNYLTQFSLDTDWVKALAEVRRMLRSNNM